MLAFFTLFWLGIAAPLSLSSRLRGRLYDVVVDIVSWIINRCLLFTKPIWSVDGSRTIPTCEYRWPNGQGDVGKFLEGEKNSESWSKEHGHVFRIWSGMTPEIVVTHPEHVRAIFKDSDHHTKATNNDAGWLMGELLGKCLGLISGTPWRDLHAVTSVPFTHKKAGTYIPQITNAVEKHFEELERNGDLMNARIHPVDDLRFLPFWVVAEIVYGKLDDTERETMSAIIPVREELFKRMIQGGITRSSWSQYLPTETNKELRKFKRQWADFNLGIYLARKASKEDAPIVGMYEAVESGSITSEALLQTLDEMLFANLDVTMGGLSWNLLFLASDAKVQDAIREEWKARRTETQDTTKAWEEYIASSSTLLNASILESGRLKPLAAFSVAQSAPSDRVVGGYRIPAGTNIIVDTHALNIGNPYWGEDGTRFRPARFLEHKALEMRYQFWRFGFGPRQCLGKYVVDLLIRAILVHLLANYRLSQLETTSWDKNPETWIAHPNTEICCERLRAVC
ncbi:cytochrome P450 monooxygenase [Lentithecium fluviatile CBS 122367]|uniref:Cytochrome P450 monooxygenase n=1 Tax=Lentithecium fluviatile CBS 122367 TaxID=1168545 RepID=A0A6G1IGN7_9PLEO|nr:cytochrome P450 monooxygenase [Lentithecium fluviatile CBS 122367]